MKSKGFSDANHILQVAICSRKVAVANQRITYRVEIIQVILHMSISVITLRRLHAAHLVANYRQIFLQAVMHMIKFAPVNFVFELIAPPVKGFDPHGFVQIQSV